MNTESTTLQVPLPKALKKNATVAAHEQGFTSLQDLVRIVLTKLARRELIVNITSTSIRLSKKAEKRYKELDKDFAQGKNIFVASSVEELMKDLTS